MRSYVSCTPLREDNKRRKAVDRKLRLSPFPPPVFPSLLVSCHATSVAGQRPRTSLFYYTMPQEEQGGTSLFKKKKRVLSQKKKKEMKAGKKHG